MEWDEFVAAAKAISWIAYLGTADHEGHPHVSVVAPGFSPGTIWFATRPASKKFRNLRVNPTVGLHWPVGSEGPGELAAWGVATPLETADAKDSIWDGGYLSYDLSSFFGPRETADVVFAEIAVSRARLLGPDFGSKVWVPEDHR